MGVVNLFARGVLGLGCAATFLWNCGWQGNALVSIMIEKWRENISSVRQFCQIRKEICRMVGGDNQATRPPV